MVVPVDAGERPLGGGLLCDRVLERGEAPVEFANVDVGLHEGTPSARICSINSPTRATASGVRVVTFRKMNPPKPASM